MTPVLIGLGVVLMVGAMIGPLMVAIEKANNGWLVIAAVAWMVFATTAAIVVLVGITSPSGTHSWAGGNGPETKCSYEWAFSKGGDYQETVCQ